MIAPAPRGFGGRTMEMAFEIKNNPLPTSRNKPRDRAPPEDFSKFEGMTDAEVQQEIDRLHRAAKVMEDHATALREWEDARKLIK
jgi:hypothetical protein